MRNTLLSLTAGVACLAGLLTTASAQTIIVPVNQAWRWNDAASGTLCLDGTGWETTGYDDSAWGGPDPGGFTGGENTAATLASLAGLLGTSTLPAPTANNGSPAYFRTHFNPGPTNNLTLILSNRYDDQIVFYINGTRVGHFNHPANPETCTISTASGGEATSWAVLTLSPAQLGGIVLPNADNVLAVSVHQNATTSSDMVMVCALSGTTATPPPAGIPFGASGSTNFTFDAAPSPLAWTTTAWSGGANGTADDFTAVDARVQALTAAGINSALASATGNPPAAGGTARYASDAGAQYILTRPTGTAGDVIMATLNNATASPVTALGINYTLTVVAPMVEEIPGHLVYYSLTGATPWTLIPDISNQPSEAVAGTYPKSANVTLNAAWNPGTLLYILWADDNGSGTPDAALEIDNVQFIQLVATPPTFANATDPTSRTVVQCSSTTLSASLIAGFPTPALQWFHGATAITGQTNSSYVIASMTSGDAGTYFLRAVNASGTSNSHTATLTYQAAPAFALVRALANVTNPNEVTLTFNLPVDPVEGNDNFNYTIHEAGGADFNTSTAVLTNGTNIVLTTAEARQEGINYTVTIVNPLASVCPGTSITGTFPVFQAQPILTYRQAWRYIDNDVDPGASWFTSGFDDSAWKTGAGPFDAKRAAAGSAGLNCRDNTLYGLGAVGTCLSLSNSVPTNTMNCFFRTHFNRAAAGTALLLLHGKFDDDALVYLNGTEVWRVGFSPTNPVVREVYGAALGQNRGAVGDNDAQDSVILSLPLVAGDNLLAVQLFQENGTSSDITMGLEVDEVLSTVHPKLSIVDDGFGGITVTWGAGTLQSALNVTGPWSDVPGASSPYNALVNTARKFYRVR